MGRDGRGAIRLVHRSDGQKPVMADLPPAQTTRWVARRKAQVVAAVRAGAITLDEACERYALTVEEFLSWRDALDHYGLNGLCVGHAQYYRHLDA